MREIVEQIESLRQETNSLQGQIHKRVLEVAKRYIVAHHTTNRGYGYPEPEYADFEWSIKSGSVEVEWDETWNYGGHDRGTFSFPVKYIWDNEALVSYEESRAEKKAAIETNKISARRTEELRQLEILKEKYPE